MFWRSKINSKVSDLENTHSFFRLRADAKEEKASHSKASGKQPTVTPLSWNPNEAARFGSAQEPPQGPSMQSKYGNFKIDHHFLLAIDSSKMFLSNTLKPEMMALFPRALMSFKTLTFQPLMINSLH